MSKTEKNLHDAFKGESEAIQKYRVFAKKAKKEGFNLIANVFLETAKNEERHAKELFKLMKGKKKQSTVENLEEAIKGENFEFESMYANFEKTAKEEGNEKAALLFKYLSEVEKSHSERFKKMLKELKEGKLYKRDKEIVWKCSECGHEHKGNEPPEKCPLCAHAREYFVPEDFVL